MQVPPGTESGHVFTLRRRGMPDPHGRAPGDLLVRADVEVPKRLSPRHEELLRELAELENTNVSPHRKSFLEKLRDYFTVNESANHDPKE